MRLMKTMIDSTLYRW